jgi:hypothetical protein
MFTVKPYFNPAQQLKLESAFCVTDSMHISFNRKSNVFAAAPAAAPDNAPAFVPTKTVQANLSVFTSEKAYKDGAQSLHNRAVSVVVDINADETAINEALLAELLTSK